MSEAGTVFKEYEKTGGSIGVDIARLWKGELGGALFSIRPDTPWDTTPVYGICKKLGFQFYKILPTSPYVEHIDPPPIKEVSAREYELLIIHKSREEELLSSLR